MSRVGICLWIAFKRMGKRPLYLCLFLLFPAAMFLVPKLNKAAAGEQIAVGYVLEQPQEADERQDFLLRELEQRLSEEKTIQTGLFEREGQAGGRNTYQYIKYTNSDELKTGVITGEISCGVLFDEEFTEKILQEDYRNCITLYLPAGMNVGGMVQEDIFVQIYQIYSALWYSELLAGEGYETEPDRVLEKFGEYRDAGKVFAVEYQDRNIRDIQGAEAEKETGTGADTGIGTRAETDTPLLSLRNALAYLTLLSACLGALDAGRDKRKRAGEGLESPGLFTAAVTGAPVLTGAVFLAAGTLWERSGTAGSAAAQIFHILGGTFLYAAVLWILAFLCGRIISEKILAGALPCYLLLTLLCTPVLFDLGQSILLIGYCGKLFPITWYLNFM